MAIFGFGNQSNKGRNSALQSFVKKPVAPPGGVRAIPSVPPPRTPSVAPSAAPPGTAPLPSYDAVRASLMAKTGPQAQQQWAPPPGAMLPQGPQGQYGRVGQQGVGLQKPDAGAPPPPLETQTYAMKSGDVPEGMAPYGQGALDADGYFWNYNPQTKKWENTGLFLGPQAGEGIHPSDEEQAAGDAAGKEMKGDDTLKPTEPPPEGPQGEVVKAGLDDGGSQVYQDENGKKWVLIGGEYYEVGSADYYAALQGNETTQEADEYKDSLKDILAEAQSETHPWDEMGAKQWQQEMDLIDMQSEADFEAASQQAAYANAAAGVSAGGTQAAGANALQAKLNLQSEAAKQQLFNDMMVVALQKKLAMFTAALSSLTGMMTTEEQIQANLTTAEMTAELNKWEQKKEYAQAGLDFVNNAYDEGDITFEEAKAKTAQILGADSEEEVAAIVASVG